MFKNEDGFFIQQDKIVDLLNSENTGLILSRGSTTNIDKQGDIEESRENLTKKNKGLVNYFSFWYPYNMI